MTGFKTLVYKDSTSRYAGKVLLYIGRTRAEAEDCYKELQACLDRLGDDPLAVRFRVFLDPSKIKSDWNGYSIFFVPSQASFVLAAALNFLYMLKQEMDIADSLAREKETAVNEIKEFYENKINELDAHYSKMVASSTDAIRKDVYEDIRLANEEAENRLRILKDGKDAVIGMLEAVRQQQAEQIALQEALIQKLEQRLSVPADWEQAAMNINALDREIGSLREELRGAETKDA